MASLLLRKYGNQPYNLSPWLVREIRVFHCIIELFSISQIWNFWNRSCLMQCIGYVNWNPNLMSLFHVLYIVHTISLAGIRMLPWISQPQAKSYCDTKVTLLYWFLVENSMNSLKTHRRINWENTWNNTT